MKKVKWLNCPKCGHPKSFKLEIGQTWMNDRDYKVKILDFGFEDVWLLYLDNQNKVAWTLEKFLEQYILTDEKKK